MSNQITPSELKRLFPLGVSKSTLLKNLPKEPPKGYAPPPATIAPPEPKKKRFRQSLKPKLNKLEAEYLLYRKALSIDETIHPQAIRFELANGLTYTPDFVCIPSSGRVRCIEVKGPHAFEDSIVKLKVAPTIYPEIQWFMVWKEKGQWMAQEALP